MDGQGKSEHSRPLRRLHQYRRPKSDATRQCECGHKFGEPVQLSHAQRKLHAVRAGRGEAEHYESDVGPGDILG